MSDDKDLFAQVDANLDTHPKIRKAGSFGRQVFEFLLRRNALRGFRGAVPLDFIDADYLADILMIAPADAVTGVTKAVTAQLIAVDEAAGVVRIVGWHESWGRRAKEGKERTREWRDRKRAEEHEPVTPGDACDARPSHVTTRDESDGSRSEEKKISDPPAPARVVVQSTGWHRRKSWWDSMRDAHRRIRDRGIEPNAPDLPNTCAGVNEANMLACERSLRESGDDEETVDRKMRHVVLVIEAECVRDRTLRYFKPALIWDPTRFNRAVDTTISEATTRAAPSRAGPQPARPTKGAIGSATPRSDHGDDSKPAREVM